MPKLLREVEDHPVHPMSKSNHGFLSGNDHEMKHLGHKIHDKDLSSESGQSHQEAPAVSESSLNENTSTQSGSALSLTILSLIIFLIFFYTTGI